MLLLGLAASVCFTEQNYMQESLHCFSGFDGGITGGIAVMEPFAQEFFPGTLGLPDSNFYCKYNNRLLQTFTSMMHFTGALAAFPSGYCTAKYGRTR